ncbi:hypothetical protein [Thermophilibacter mediterraneus]|nr:hypothetical protein [Thermophilibacter mediterraneus]
MRRLGVVIALVALVGGCAFLGGCSSTEDGVGWEAHYEFEF